MIVIHFLIFVLDSFGLCCLFNLFRSILVNYLYLLYVSSLIGYCVLRFPIRLPDRINGKRNN